MESRGATWASTRLLMAMFFAAELAIVPLKSHNITSIFLGFFCTQKIVEHS